MSDRTLVAGVDSSTQATKIVVCDAQTGEVVRASRAPHPDGTEVHPDRWWEAYTLASADGILDGVQSIAVGGQQHGMVTLDDDDEVVRDARLWNDTRSAPAAAAKGQRLGRAAPVHPQRSGRTRQQFCALPGAAGGCSCAGTVGRA